MSKTNNSKTIKTNNSKTEYDRVCAVYWEVDAIMRLSLSAQIQVGDNLSPYLNEGC